jgi:flagellin-specific chaperone FliS
VEFKDESIDKFIAIYKAEFGETLSHEDAKAMARRLVNLYRLFARPLPNGEKGQ